MGPFPRSDHCPFASRAAAPRTGVPVVTAEARSAPSLLRRLLLRRRTASVGRLLKRRRASDSHAAATVAAAPAVAVAPATWRLYRGASTPFRWAMQWPVARGGIAGCRPERQRPRGPRSLPLRPDRLQHLANNAAGETSRLVAERTSRRRRFEAYRSSSGETQLSHTAGLPYRRGALVVSLDAAGLRSDHERRPGEDPAASALGQGCRNPRSAQPGARSYAVGAVSGIGAAGAAALVGPYAACARSREASSSARRASALLFARLRMARTTGAAARSASGACFQAYSNAIRVLPVGSRSRV